ncbi:MAG: RidA family protein [Anaerolineae bacterium]|nr:RidA family protein [Anaerolineae bacterium]
MATVKRIATPYSYSSAVAAGDFVFVGLHRGFGATFAEQHEDIFKHLQGTLAQFGLSLADLVKVNVWLKEIKDLPEMEKLFRNHFEQGQYPARMTSTTEFIDADCLIMIEGVAYGNTNYT